MRFEHTVEYPDGTVIKGRRDLRQQPEFCGVPDMTGLTVLDIASNDGGLAFVCEKLGAKSVLATDVDSYEGYDWGSHKPDTSQMPQQDKSAAFWAHHRAMDSKVQRLNLDVYKLDRLSLCGAQPDPIGPADFDIIFNYGLLYHLRHPLFALEQCAGVCAGMMALESHVWLGPPGPVMMFCESGFQDPSDFTLATPQIICAWMRSAGFKHVFMENKVRIKDRMRFIGTMTDEWRHRQLANPNFIEV